MGEQERLVEIVNKLAELDVELGAIAALIEAGDPPAELKDHSDKAGELLEEVGEIFEEILS